MVRGYHLIMTAYGFWLPNDPRGSWSDFVRAFELQRFGDATKVTTHESLAHRPHNVEERLLAKEFLARPAVKFDGLQARAIARGMAEHASKSGLVVYAAAIMPDHVHLVTRRHRYFIEQVANLLKGAATRKLSEEGVHPFKDNCYRNGDRPTPWARKHWKCFLNTEEDFRSAIQYTNDNPVRDGMKRQSWGFVTPFGE